jgi:transposase
MQALRSGQSLCVYQNPEEIEMKKGLQVMDTSASGIMYMALELSLATWKVGFSDGHDHRFIAVEGGDLGALVKQVAVAKEKLGLTPNASVLSCYEAGRDGFWLHRALEQEGIENLVIDSASILVDRRQRRAKTDSLDVRSLLSQLIAHRRDKQRMFSVVRVPSVAAEDLRRTGRELGRLQKERKQHVSRIQSLLMTHGIRVSTSQAQRADIASLRMHDGSELGVSLRAELVREQKRVALVVEQITTLSAEREAQLVSPLDSEQMTTVTQLRALCGIGPLSSWLFVTEFFGWRTFANRRELAAAAGLTPTPFSSGELSREQGISKAGNRRVRAMIIEIAWCWLRYQPQSELSLWYQRRFGAGQKSRMRRIGIVALARRLLVDLWRYVRDGVVPAGARFKQLEA